MFGLWESSVNELSRSKSWRIAVLDVRVGEFSPFSSSSVNICRNDVEGVCLFICNAGNCCSCVGWLVVSELIVTGSSKLTSGGAWLVAEEATCCWLVFSIPVVSEWIFSGFCVHVAWLAEDVSEDVSEVIIAGSCNVMSGVHVAWLVFSIPFVSERIFSGSCVQVAWWAEDVSEDFSEVIIAGSCNVVSGVHVAWLTVFSMSHFGCCTVNILAAGFWKGSKYSVVSVLLFYSAL